MAYSIGSLEVADNPIVLFRGIVGSRAYGTQNANSDTDVRGIFVVPSAEYARLAQPPKQVSDERNDRTYYSLVRFCELMAEANPTTMEMLFLPEDCILKTSPAHSMLVANRGLFVTQKAVDSHLGYALSQIKKAKGTNKRVWNPWPEEPPQAVSERTKASKANLSWIFFIGSASFHIWREGRLIMNQSPM